MKPFFPDGEAARRCGATWKRRSRRSPQSAVRRVPSTGRAAQSGAVDVDSDADGLPHLPRLPHGVPEPRPGREGPTIRLLLDETIDRGPAGRIGVVVVMDIASRAVVSLYIT
jgi:hypothetical protein